MSAKRKAQDTDQQAENMPSGFLKRKRMSQESAYTTSQKNAIAQFAAVTGSDRTVAARFLKSANWNLNTATNTWYGSSKAHPADEPALEVLFEKYKKAGESSEFMDMTATQKYFTDIGVNFEDVSMLVASQIVLCPSLGEVTKEGFVKGWSELRCTTIAKQKEAITNYKANLGKSDILEKVYKHAFSLMMQNTGQRSADKATCIEFWKILLSKPSLAWRTANVAWLNEWILFVENHRSLKTISRDQWNHVLKFARETLNDENLGFHSEEQSWPSIIDEFADVMKVKVRGGGKIEDAEMTY